MMDPTTEYEVLEEALREIRSTPQVVVRQLDDHDNLYDHRIPTPFIYERTRVQKGNDYDSLRTNH